MGRHRGNRKIQYSLDDIHHLTLNLKIILRYIHEFGFAVQNGGVLSIKQYLSTCRDKIEAIEEKTFISKEDDKVHVFLSFSQYDKQKSPCAHG